MRDGVEAGGRAEASAAGTKRSGRGKQVTQALMHVSTQI
jgi:hypothetical protein